MIRVRVVCGLSEVMATLVPRMRLSERGLPDVGSADEGDEAGAHQSGATLVLRGGGRRTRPMRRPCTRWAVSSQPVDHDALAVGGHVAELGEQQPADRVPVALGELGPQQLVDLVERQAGVDPHAAVGERLDHRVLDVELVDDLAEQLLDDVLEGHEPGGAAVLVDHDRHVEPVLLHLPQQRRRPRLVSGTKRAGRASSATVRSSRPSRSARMRSLAWTTPTMSSMPARAHGDPAVAVEDHDLHRVGDPEVGGDRDHVGSRHHHLAHDGVAELDDRLDELALLGLDDVLLHREVGHGEELLLRRVRAPLEALARQEHVGEADQAARQQPERAAAGQRAPHGPGGGQRGTVGVLDGPGLRRHLGHDEEQRDVEHRGADDAPAAERCRLASTPSRVDCTSCVDSTTSRTGLSHSWCSTRRSEDLAPAPGRLGQRLGLGPGHAGERGLRHGQHDRREEQHDDRDQRSRQSARVHRSVVELVEELALAGLHRGGLLRLGVVHAEHVEDPVHDEQRDLVVVAAGVGRAPAGRRRPGTPPRRRAAAAARRARAARGRGRCCPSRASARSRSGRRSGRPARRWGPPCP